MSHPLDQIQETTAAFEGLATTPALIGGLALAVHNIVRATRDTNFLVDADDGDHIHHVPTGLGYRCIHRSRDTANYLHDDESMNFVAPKPGVCSLRPRDVTCASESFAS